MEIEMKLAPVPHKTAFDILEKEPFYITDAQKITMQASYYDTLDKALKKHGVSLRLRKENDQSVCCLKMKVSDIARHEFEVYADSIAEGISKLCQNSDIPGSIKQLIKNTDIVCMFSSRFERTLRLASSGDSKIEIAYDSGQLMQDNRFCSVSEVELELKEGNDADLIALCSYLQEKYSLTLSHSTKAGRAAALTEQAFDCLEVLESGALTPSELQTAYQMGRLWKKQTNRGDIYYKTDSYQ